jgi:hypothetical protein
MHYHRKKPSCNGDDESASMQLQKVFILSIHKSGIVSEQVPHALSSQKTLLQW